MAGFKFNQMGKYLKDFGLYFRRKKPKRTEEDESTEDEKAFAGDARDETPGDIQMHSGSHKPVYGIRRKIIGGISDGNFETSHRCGGHRARQPRVYGAGRKKGH